MRAFVIVMVVLMVVAGMVVDIGKARPRTHMEGLALLTAQETWLRQARVIEVELDEGDAGRAWLLPSQNGAVRVRKPPMLVWLNMLAWTGLQPGEATVEQLTGRARLVTAGLAMVMALTVWWLGRVLARRMGDVGGNVGWWPLISAGVTLTLPFVQDHARLASYDMHVAAWGTLAGVAAVAAMAGDGKALWKWGVAALALAMAWMSKGPVALLIAGLPMVAGVCCISQAKGRDVLRMIACMAVGAALVTPWYAYLYMKEPEAWRTLWHEYGASLTNYHGVHYYIVELFRWSQPWTLWVFAGVVVLWRVAQRGNTAERRAIGFVWLWYALVLLAFTLPDGKAMRYIVAISAPMGLIVGVVWRELAMRIRCGALGGWRGFVMAHWVVLLLATVVVVALVGWQAELVTWGVLEKAKLVPMGKGAAVALGVVLLGMCVMGWAVSRRSAGAMAAISLVWMAVASGAVWWCEARAEREADEVEREAMAVRRIVGESEMRYVRGSAAEPPDYEFVLFMQRVIAGVKAEEIAALGDGVFVMSGEAERERNVMERAGYQEVAVFRDHPERGRLLWRR